MNKKSLTILALSLATAMGMSAQSRILTILEANTDARSAAMGNTMLGNSDQMNIYSNPAALTFGDRTLRADATMEVYPKAENGRLMQYNVAGGYRFKNGSALMAGFRYQNGLTVEAVNSENPGARLRPHEMTLDLGYSFAVTKEVAVYVTGTYAKSHQATSTEAWAFSVGAAYQKPFSLSSMPTVLTVGARLMDLGKSVKFDDAGLFHSLPTSVVLGGDWGVALTDEHKLTYALSCRYFTPKDAHETLVGTGLEYTYNKMVSARVGYQFADQGSDEFTCGLGGEYAGFKLNLSYNHAFSFYGLDTFMVGVGYSF
ncbi:PorV/PorQ family protein [Prevotella sp.]|uniref:PorV/PorQ family protein n=1 Tax=Prevotella sp. TaxID=59823 RepID=UPI002F93283D